ncbi:nuclear transport factor 2 family protein [Streptosporangium sp. NPDC048047]|uniref:nuclear transport factor 2 family protein n=1 Tax=Streptosporangium sp. NPDC048047 TaxID=3155748 RepID=UPI003424735F
MASVYEYPVDGFTPTAEDVASVEAWFARYDDLAMKVDGEAMADMAMFPLNEVTDDSAGNGFAEQVTREEYVRQMAETMGAPGEVSMESVRKPIFLSKNLVFVVTDAVMTYGGQSHIARYGDLLVKKDGEWVFQTMVQGGWGDMRKAARQGA